METILRAFRQWFQNYNSGSGHNYNGSILSRLRRVSRRGPRGPCPSEPLIPKQVVPLAFRFPVTYGAGSSARDPARTEKNIMDNNYLEVNNYLTSLHLLSFEDGNLKKNIELIEIESKLQKLGISINWDLLK